jgi:excisionase family DNA binding protein
VADMAFVEDRLLTAAELAEVLNVTPHWIRRHTANGDIPHLRLGKYPRYRLSRVLAWLEDQERGGALPTRRSRRGTAVAR